MSAAFALPARRPSHSRPRVENPARTAAHLATLDQRRTGLKDDFARILPPAAEFVWEVGSGHGHFLTAYAQAHPERLCLGIDLVLERVLRAERKRNRAKLANLHFLRAEAGVFLEALPADARFSAIFILFPDPWPKRRHHKHRLMQPAFLDRVAARARPDARLHFRTDDLEYYTDALATARQHPAWELVTEPWPFETTTVFQARAPSYQSLSARLRG